MIVHKPERNPPKMLSDTMDGIHPMSVPQYQATKEWPVVLEARAYAKKQLEFYEHMMAEKLENQRSNKGTRRIILIF